MEVDNRNLTEDYKRRVKRIEQVGILVGSYAAQYLSKHPIRTSDHTGSKWVDEVLYGHPKRCFEQFRMEPRVFFDLCTALQQLGLKESQNVGIHEKVAIFLNIVGHGETSRMMQERFQHSRETIHKHFHDVLLACCGFAMSVIKPQDPTFQNVHSKIKLDCRYWPFFKNAIGAFDGTHIHCIVPANEQTKYIGRKEFTSQNVMVVCDWDMCFTFVLAGWEGSAYDACIFSHALTTPSMNFPHPPQGKYYLVDTGYPTPIGYLGPYRRERYHLPDFLRSSRLVNPNEVFNYAHSSLRCIIERTFGVWKNKFEILQRMRSYDYEMQVKIVSATMAIHNFIRRTSITDPDFTREDEDDDEPPQDDDGDDEYDSSRIPVSITSLSEMARRRDFIRDQLIYYREDR